MVSLVAKGADPDLGREVNPREGIEGCRAGFASERRVRKRGNVRVRADRRYAGRKWDHALASLHLGARPHVPRHAHSVKTLRICVCHLRHLCSSDQFRFHKIQDAWNQNWKFACAFFVFTGTREKEGRPLEKSERKGSPQRGRERERERGVWEGSGQSTTMCALKR